MSQSQIDPDKLVIKQQKGTWKRFVKLFPKCHLPWLWIILYAILSIFFVNVGLNETEYTARLFAGDTSTALLSKLIGVMVINLLLGSLVTFTRQVTSARTDRNMRNVLFQKVNHLPLHYFKDENPRDAIYRIVANATVLSNTIIFVIFPLATAIYTAVSVFSRVFQYDWRLSAILIGFIPFQILIAFMFGRLNYSLSERDASLNATLMQRLAELVTNIPLAKAFGKEEKESENGAELTQRLYKINIKASWLSQFKDLSETIVSLTQSVIIVFVGVLLLNNQAITIRAWISFFMFSSIFTGSVTKFMMYWNNLKEIQGSANRIADIMNAAEEDESGERCCGLIGDIHLNNVRFGYDAEEPVLHDISCTFQDHCVTALLGASGCGKTTLMNLLIRLYAPQSGQIRIGPKSVYDYALDDYRSQFVMVSQSGMLFSGTIRENVCYGNGEVDEQALTNALKEAGAYDFVMNLPNGLDTMVEEYGKNLSGGQRQRLCVARALLSDAHYLILDEPVASMDAIATAELMEILRNIAANRCMIIIAHTTAVLPIADRLVVIEDGVVAAEGTVDEVKKSSRFFAAFVGKKVA